MKPRSLFFAFAALALLRAGALGADQTDTGLGQQAAPFLTWPADARTAAMGQAGVASVSDVNAPVLNPAGLQGVTGEQYCLSEDLLFQGTDLANAAAAFGVAPGAGFGVDATYLNVGAVGRSVIENGVIEQAGSFSPYYYAVGAGYGQRLWSVLSLGAEAKVVGDNLDGDSAATAAGDFGLQVETGIRGLKAGASVQNLGGTLDGFQLPALGRAGLSYGTPFWGHRNDLLLNVDCQIPKAAYGQATVSAGAELRYARFLTLRVGYQNGQVGGVTGLTGVTAGAGFGANWWQVDYAWVPEGDLGLGNQFSFSAKF